jgi:hypothetical protein
MKADKRRKHKKLNKAYDTIKNEAAVVFQKQYAIDDEGNTYLQEIPLAIGRRVASSTTEPLCSPEDIKKETKGVAVEIDHYFLDELWNIGSQQMNISDECSKVIIKNADGTVPTKEIKSQENDIETGQNGELKPTEDKEHKDEEKKLKKKDEKNNSTDDIEEEKEPQESGISRDEMDSLIKRNFAFCIVRHLKDEQLPMEPSYLQGELMHRYEHNLDGRIDFKRSSYNKVTKFLKKMKQQKLISFAKPKGGDHEIITEFNRKSNFEMLTK